MQCRLLRMLCVLLTLGIADSAFAAAQLRAGAKTSAQPTATNPQQRQIQITFDPDITADPGAVIGDLPNYSVTSFKLSVEYTNSALTVQDVLFVAPFTETQSQVTSIASPFAATTGTPGTRYVDDNEVGVIHNLAGHAAANAVPAGADVNIFAVDFLLDPEASLDTPLTFTIFADPDQGDFVMGTDPNTGQTITTPAADVIPTTITLSFNDATNQVNATPLPAGAAAGLLTLSLLGAAYALKRRMLAA